MTAPETQADLMKIAKEKGYNNAGGGVYNHDLFWQAMAPAGKGGAPSAALAAAIDKAFGSMDAMKEQWEALAAPASTFGSGWVWLYVKGKDLAIGNTPNQDNPLMKGANVEGRGPGGRRVSVARRNRRPRGRSGRARVAAPPRMPRGSSVARRSPSSMIFAASASRRP